MFQHPHIQCIQLVHCATICTAGLPVGAHCAHLLTRVTPASFVESTPQVGYEHACTVFRHN